MFHQCVPRRYHSSLLLSFGGKSSKNGGVAGIGEVGEEIVDRAGAGIDGLEPSPHDSQHRQPPILDLLCS